MLRASAGSREALEELGTLYRPVVLAFFRRCGLSLEDAEDATQKTLIRLLNQAGLAKVSPENGRFRAFLCACARNELSHFRQHGMAQKRAAALTTSLDGLETDQQLPSVRPPDEQIFDCAYGQMLVSRAVAKLQGEYERLGKGDVFANLLPFLREGRERGGHGEIAGKLGISEVNARVMWSRFKASFVSHVRFEVSQTVASDAEIDDELRYLVQAWLSRPESKEA